jgi:hypothetical protein
MQDEQATVDELRMCLASIASAARCLKRGGPKGLSSEELLDQILERALRAAYVLATATSAEAERPKFVDTE